jgi:CheY-like chemotaxis protein
MQQGTEALITVRDEGTGIRVDLLPHIFDLFVQEDRSLERSRGGLGIGLTVVRRLVERHGGTISARSQGPGHGSEFIIRLPIAALPTSSATTAAPTAAVAKMASHRILVVDDNVDAAESLAVLLRLWGHQVRVAHTGPEALKVAHESHPEMLILDIGLPEMSGYEVARRLRQQPQFGKAIIVAVTGYGQAEDRRRTEEAGFDHHLTKPVDPAALESLVRSLPS